MKKTMMLAAAVGLALTANASADEVGRWYFTPQVGALITDEDRNLPGDGDRLFGLALGRHVNDSWSLELNANGAKVDGWSPYVLSLDALRVFARDRAVSPFISIGAGAQRNDAKLGRDTTDAIAQAGAGLIWTLGENRRGTGAFSVRPELKVRWDDAGREDYFDVIAALGLQFSFGGQARAEAAPDPAPVAAQPVAPAPAAPRDEDRDGVIDERDRCPRTPAGVAVDEDGCARQGAVTLIGVQFAYDSAELTRESSAVLDQVAADLKKYPRLEVELQGHTDSVGSDRYNLALSQRRAESVRSYLLQAGVGANQVVARGYGESQPIATNDTPDGRALNRRVVMVVLQNPGNVPVKAD
jgi:OOP family OmpA-OmpF porin